MKDKMQRERQLVEADKKFFHDFGKTAADKFYRNEDMRKSKERNLKGQGSTQA